MPALLTHYLCGNAMLKLMEDAPDRDFILKHRNVFNLGTQGPDIFFYYGAWPWTKNNGMAGFGERMHEEKTGEFISQALKYINGAQACSKEILTAYICGYLCHYELDCHTHPYIFYKTGFVRKGEEYTAKYTCYHRMFETALDVLMLKRELNKTPKSFNASERIRISGDAAAAIGKMYAAVLKEVYAVDISPESVCRAIADMAGISAALRDRTGIKKRLLSKLEKSLGKQPMFSSMILPHDINDGLDYLNLSRSIWHLPWDNSLPLKASFVESFDAAAAESKRLSGSIFLYNIGRADLEVVMALIENRSFSTGEDCNKDLEFKYFDCIYE